MKSNYIKTICHISMTKCQLINIGLVFDKKKHIFIKK